MVFVQLRAVVVLYEQGYLKHVLIDVNSCHGTSNRTKYVDVTEADNVDFQFLVEVKYFQIRALRCDFAENSPKNYVHGTFQKFADPSVFDGPGINDRLWSVDLWRLLFVRD